jgi:prepilin-type processing-associated H-X9-DG protein
MNQLRVDLMPVLHCPERVQELSFPFLDYLVNAMPSIAPAPGAEWGQVAESKVDAYKRPSEVIYVCDAEKESKNEGGVDPLLKDARQNWKAGHEYWPENPAQADAEWGKGAICVMDVWRGMHLPQGNGAGNWNVTDAPGPRRVARKTHLDRFTNAAFFDGHAEGVSAIDLGDDRSNYAYWLKLFGVNDPTEVALTDDMR